MGSNDHFAQTVTNCFQLKYKGIDQGQWSYIKYYKSLVNQEDYRKRMENYSSSIYRVFVMSKEQY